MLTPKISGIFNCRKYDQTGKRPYEQRELMADTDNVTFSTTFGMNEIPECLQGATDNMKPIVSRKEREDAEHDGRQPQADRVAVRFKIGQRTNWFDKNAKPCARPTNEELDGKRFMVQLDFVKREKDPANPLKASGLWVNSIMYAEITNNPFAGQAFEQDTEEQEQEEVQLPFDI